MQKRQLWKPFTIMLVPHSSAQVRSIFISKTLIWLLVGIIFMMGAGAGYFVYKFSEYRRSTNEFETYKQQTEQIRKEYDSLAGTAETVNQKLEVLQQLENDLRTKNGLPPVTEKPTAEEGQGGVLQSRSGLKRPYMILNKDALAVLDKKANQRIESTHQTMDMVARKEADRKAEEQRKQEAIARTPDIWPTGSRNVTSGFGYRKDPYNGYYSLHTGIDISGSYGSPVISTAKGVVTHAGWDGGYGISVTVDHGNGLVTRYGHLSGVSVESGQAVKKGDQVGQMGSTGRSTGTHLHYEVIKDGVQVSPTQYLP
ncbi:M23 family metallopeptidase [Effusibacillus lacus]|uniref:Peptidase M23 n=1 Tax=Effusibacillus lacus TaxID=1348429 RepID=A0A292YGN0_9BACL|nr:M23 family metallopeptidase [Effusibacillus lacus]TCS74736.1 murein DD-endopeptidase MepM/ murein hydrolase activator NlpD [Effusibacillus lacus]GAX88548.1 peptidase M23 [Effusibacillus lacus]